MSETIRKRKHVSSNQLAACQVQSRTSSISNDSGVHEDTDSECEVNPPKLRSMNDPNNFPVDE